MIASNPYCGSQPEVRGSQLIVDELLPDTSRGRDAAVMIRNGTFRGLSVEFKAERQHRAGGVRHITKAQLHGAALVGSRILQEPPGSTKGCGRYEAHRVHSMAITLTVAELAAALRLSDTDEETGRSY